MKGVSFRRKAPSRNYARIIWKIDESIWDKFVTQEEAIKLYCAGKIVPVYIGRDYPFSFKYT